MSIYAIQKQAAPPSGVSHCISARLTPSCLLLHEEEQGGPSTSSHSRIIRNLVTARSNYLQIFEVVEELRDAPAVASSLVNGGSTRINGDSNAMEGLEVSSDRGASRNAGIKADVLVFIASRLSWLAVDDSPSF